VTGNADSTVYLGGRVPPELKQRVEAMARRNRRSTTAEIILALEQRLRDDERDRSRQAEPAGV